MSVLDAPTLDHCSVDAISPTNLFEPVANGFVNILGDPAKVKVRRYLKGGHLEQVVHIRDATISEDRNGRVRVRGTAFDANGPKGIVEIAITPGTNKCKGCGSGRR